MCALPVWGFWWVFPLVGMLVCLAFFLVMLRSGRAGHGCMGMGGHRSTRDEAR
jgi:hypothetical protein